MLPLAAQPDIVRASQKDDSFIQGFQDECKELFQALRGREADVWDKEIELLSALCYHACTTLQGQQTLGEEFCDIIPVLVKVNNESSSHGSEQKEKKTPDLLMLNMNLPTFSRRGWFVLLRIFVPYIHHRLKVGGPLIAPRNSKIRSFFYGIWNRIADAVIRSDSSITQLLRLHLAIFYLFGGFLHLSNRFAGVRYAMLRRLDFPRPGYQILGLLILIQLAISASQRYRASGSDGVELGDESDTADAESKEFQEAELSRRRLDEKTDSSSAEEETEESERLKCSLCFGQRNFTTATECGHLFCWTCITQALNAKPECPLCRQTCSLSRLVRLANYL